MCLGSHTVLNKYNSYRPATMNGHGDELASESPSTTHVPERYRREVNSIEHYTGVTGHLGINSSSILSNLSLPNITNNMSEPQYGAHQPYLAAVVYGKTMIVLPDLQHFTEYSIEVIACHEVVDGETEKRCSNRAITTGRTLALGMPVLNCCPCRLMLFITRSI